MADMNRNITSADASIVLTADTVFPSGITLEMFSADQAWTADAVDIAETRMGVDGQMVSGFTPNIKTVTVSLEPPSPSRAKLATLWEAMETNKTTYAVGMVISLPATQETYTFSNGVLKNGNPLPAGAKTLQPTTWQFDFEKVERSTLG